MLDLVDWLIGPFGSVMAATQIAYPERPSPDDPSRKARRSTPKTAWCVLARMRSGALGTIEATKLATGTEDELRLEIHGSRGALRFNGMDPHHLEFHDATAPDRPLGGLRGWNRIDAGQRYPPPATGFPQPKAAIGWLRSHVACLANFLAGGGRRPARRAGPATRHSRPAPDGLPAAVGPRTSLGRHLRIARLPSFSL